MFPNVQCGCGCIPCGLGLYAYAVQGLDGAVVLSSSVQLADKLRLTCGLEHHPILPHGAATAHMADPAVGRIVIVKAYLGRTAQVGNLCA